MDSCKKMISSETQTVHYINSTYNKIKLETKTSRENQPTISLLNAFNAADGHEDNADKMFHNLHSTFHNLSCKNIPSFV
jgi:hypothetical protein